VPGQTEIGVQDEPFGGSSGNASKHSIADFASFGNTKKATCAVDAGRRSHQLTWLTFYAIISADEHIRKGERKMSTGQAIKQRVYQGLEGLPSESFEELSRFLDFLKFKYRVQQPRKAVALGGLWKHLDFDVTDAEVRALRQRVTAQLLRKV